jgi:hypothetical protein
VERASKSVGSMSNDSALSAFFCGGKRMFSNECRAESSEMQHKILSYVYCTMRLHMCCTMCGVLIPAHCSGFKRRKTINRSVVAAPCPGDIKPKCQDFQAPPCVLSLVAKLYKTTQDQCQSILHSPNDSGGGCTPYPCTPL